MYEMTYRIDVWWIFGGRRNQSNGVLKFFKGKDAKTKRGKR